MSKIDSIITSEFLKSHLKYVYHTEPPLLMHIWSALTAAGAALGRHAYVSMGFKKTYANNFCLLVGPPGTRKNTAINLAVDLLEQSTNVKFAPDDTGGMRQGLIAAIMNSDSDSETRKAADMFDLGNFDSNDLESLGKLSLSVGDDIDKHTLFIKATEFGSFLGQGSVEMTRFLIKMWDCESYAYSLKSEKLILKNACVNLLGGTTSADLSTLLPTESIGQGFMSRIILVYAPSKYKSVPPSKVSLDLSQVDYLKDTYKYLFKVCKGEIKKSPEAAELEDEIYLKNIKLSDTRFTHYSERRGDHLMKIALILATVNRSDTIHASHYLEAQAILVETEKYMSDALGEYGMSPLAISKQQMVEFINHANGPVTAAILWATMRKNMRAIDFRNALSELVNANKIAEVDTLHGKAFIYTDASSKVVKKDKVSNSELAALFAKE